MAEPSTADQLPVLAEVRPLERPPEAPLPVLRRESVQVAAVAAAGAVAGAAAATVLRRRGVRRRRRRRQDALQIVSSRSFLVDVHLVERR